MKAHELLNSPRRWGRYSYASDDAGYSQPVFGPEASCYCLLGSLIRCYADPNPQPDEASYLVTPAYVAARQRLEAAYPNPTSLNDDPNTTFEQVHALLVELDL